MALTPTESSLTRFLERRERIRDARDSVVLRDAPAGLAGVGIARRPRVGVGCVSKTGTGSNWPATRAAHRVPIQRPADLGARCRCDALFAAGVRRGEKCWLQLAADLWLSIS